MKPINVIGVTCALMVTMATIVSGGIMCEHLEIKLGSKKMHCCFNDVCCFDFESMCRKVEISDGRMEIMPVEASFVACPIRQLKNRVCCDNLSSACNCPDGYVMCDETEE